ncbi:MAG: hypothetical protein R2718_06455 [Solirubrobacterales bacterium]
MIGAFFLAGIALLVAGGFVTTANALDPWQWGRWLGLHLIFVGGISQLVLGASQFFAGAFLATDPPRPAWIRFQLGLWNLGTILLAIAVPIRSDVLIDSAVASLLAGLACYGASLYLMYRGSLQAAPWSVRWYAAAAAFLGFGVVAGSMLATSRPWVHGDLLSAHMSLNVAGWFGTAIVGTLHTFFPSLTRSRLGAPRLQLPTFIAWVTGVAALAIGYGWSVDPLALTGWFALSLATALLTVNLMLSIRVAPRPLTLPARLLALAQGFLLTGLVLMCVRAVGPGPTAVLSGDARSAAGTLLISGWVGVTVLGSLFHLLAVLVRVRDLTRPMPSPHLIPDQITTSLLAVGVLGLAAAELAGAPRLKELGFVVLAIGYLMIVSRVLPLAARVVRYARPNI